MIIGIDASRANHNQKTGVEEYAFQLIQYLKEITPDTVQVILYTDKPLQGELAVLPRRWTQKILKWPPRRLWTQIRLSWEMFFKPPDVLFIPAHVFPIIHPQRTVMTVHDIAAIRFPESYNWFERWYTLWSSKYAVKKLYKVIVPSEFTKQELISNFSTPRRDPVFAAGQFPISNNIEVIYHGYDRRYEIGDKNNIEIILKKYNLEKPYLLSVGRLEEKKNIVNIIKSFEKLKHVIARNEVTKQSQASREIAASADANRLPHNDSLQLVLVGKPGYGYEKVKQAIYKSTYQSDIIQPGWIEEEELPYLMSAAEVFVFPSLYEGFGLPILEAMACGTPVVASGGAASQEVGGDACLYVDSQNVEEISNSVIKILSDEGLRKSLISNGLERIKNFSWEKSGRETLSVLLN